MRQIPLGRKAVEWFSICMLAPSSITRSNSAIFETCCTRKKRTRNNLKRFHLNNLTHYNRKRIDSMSKQMSSDKKMTFQLQNSSYSPIY